MDFAVNTAELRRAAALVHEAHGFFGDKLTGLREIVADSADGPFVGGVGETGGYQGQLRMFNKRFGEVFQEFVDDEEQFVKFLGQVHARLNQNASLYDETENRNVRRLGSVAKMLDEPAG